MRRTRPLAPRTPEVHGVPLPRVAPVKDCAAHGCPLAGTWSDQIYETPDNPSRWWCFVHSNLKEYDYQDLTREIRKQMPLLEAYAKAHREHDKSTFTITRRAIIDAIDKALRNREPGSDDE